METASSSPESVPSLAELSHVSKDGSSSQGDDVRRELFPENLDDDSQKWQSMIAEITLPFSPCGEDVSLSAPEDKFLDIMNSSNSCFGEASLETKNMSGSNPQAAKSPVTPSKQPLSELFSVFDGYKYKYIQPSAAWPPRSKTESPLDVDETSEDACSFVSSAKVSTSANVSGLKAYSELERECQVLKDIVSVDSMSNAKLKSTIENLKSINIHLLSTVNLLTSDLKSARVEIESIQRSNAEKEEREVAHTDTIAILKAEIDRLSVKKYYTPTAHQEISRLKFESELFASQILENESELAEVKSSLESEVTVKEDLKRQVDALQFRVLEMELHEELLAEEFEAKIKVKNGAVKRYTLKLEQIEAKVQELKEQRNTVSEQREAKRKQEQADQIKMLIQITQLEQELEKSTQTVREQERDIRELQQKVRTEYEERGNKDCHQCEVLESMWPLTGWHTQ